MPPLLAVVLNASHEDIETASTFKLLISIAQFKGSVIMQSAIAIELLFLDGDTGLDIHASSFSNVTTEGIRLLLALSFPFFFFSDFELLPLFFPIPVGPLRGRETLVGLA